MCVEYQWDTPSGPRVARALAGSVDHVYLSVTYSKNNDAAPWSDVVGVAELQATKIRSKMSRA